MINACDYLRLDRDKGQSRPIARLQRLFTPPLFFLLNLNPTVCVYVYGRWAWFAFKQKLGVWAENSKSCIYSSHGCVIVGESIH